MAKKYPAIQILRFVAASFVVIDHALSNVVQNWSDAAYFDPIAWAFGELGVIVFFGISGFIMADTQYESFGSVRGAISFAVRRVARILPIYAVATTLEYLNRMHRGGAYNLLNLVKSLLFIPYAGDGGLYQPVLGQGWTLNYEMFFYLVFALSLCLMRPVGLLLSAGVFVALALLPGVAQGGGVLDFYTNHILLYFVCGMLVGVVNKRAKFSISNSLLPTTGVALLMALAVLIRINLSAWSFLPVGLVIVVACVYLCAIYGSEISSRIQVLLERLGDASYSTYLFHGFLLGAMKGISRRIEDHAYVGAFTFIVLCVVLANLAGWLAFRFVERPIARLVASRGGRDRHPIAQSLPQRKLRSEHP